MRNVDESLIWFTSIMKHKLDMNEHKGGWDHESPKDLLMLLLVECTELAEAIQHGNAEDVVWECGDVANFAMMIADVAKKYLAKKGVELSE